MNRPPWAPRNDVERVELARLDVLIEEQARINAEVLRQAQKLMEMRIPVGEIVRRTGISKATLYRKVGPSAANPNG